MTTRKSSDDLPEPFLITTHRNNVENACQILPANRRKPPSFPPMAGSTVDVDLIAVGNGQHQCLLPDLTVESNEAGTIS